MFVCSLVSQLMRRGKSSAKASLDRLPTTVLLLIQEYKTFSFALFVCLFDSLLISNSNPNVELAEEDRI